MVEILYENDRPRRSPCGKKTNRWSPPSLTAVLKDAVEHGHGVLKTTHVPISDMQTGDQRLYKSREWDPVHGRWKTPEVGAVKHDIVAKFDPYHSSYILPEPKVEKNQLDHPNYYTETGIPSGIEAWDHYELAMTPEEFQGAMKNNLYKYIFRAGHKDSETAVKDLKKAINYLKRWISYLEGHRIVWMRGTKHDSKV